MILVKAEDGSYREVSEDAINNGADSLRESGLIPREGSAEDAYRTAAFFAYLAMGGQDIRQT